jgi:hypothetical protein
MKVLFIHPGCLMYAEIYLRLEPLGFRMLWEFNSVYNPSRELLLSVGLVMSGGTP